MKTVYVKTFFLFSSLLLLAGCQGIQGPDSPEALRYLKSVHQKAQSQASEEVAHEGGQHDHDHEDDHEASHDDHGGEHDHGDDGHDEHDHDEDDHEEKGHDDHGEHEHSDHDDDAIAKHQPPGWYDGIMHYMDETLDSEEAEQLVLWIANGKVWGEVQLVDEDVYLSCVGRRSYDDCEELEDVSAMPAEPDFGDDHAAGEGGS